MRAQGLLLLKHARNLVVVCHALGVTLSREWLTPPCGSGKKMSAWHSVALSCSACLLGSMQMTNSRAYLWCWLAGAFPELRLGKVWWCSFDNYSLGSGPPWPCQAPKPPGEGGHNGDSRLPRLIPLSQGFFGRSGLSVARNVIPCQLEGARERTRWV
jgi:hypothetical protein